MCMFIGYPKRMRGGIFYSPKDKKAFVSINYMKNYKSKSTVILEELASSQETPKKLEILPHVPIYVQRGEMYSKVNKHRNQQSNR